MDKNDASHLHQRSSQDARILHDAINSLKEHGTILPKILTDLRKSNNEMSLRRDIQREAAEMNCFSVELGERAPSSKQPKRKKNKIDVLVAVETNKEINREEIVIFDNLSISELALFNDNFSKMENWSITSVGPTGTAPQMKADWILKEFHKTLKEIGSQKKQPLITKNNIKFSAPRTKKSGNEHTDNIEVTYIAPKRIPNMDRTKISAQKLELTH